AELDRRRSRIVDDVVDDRSGRVSLEIGISPHVVRVEVSDDGDLPAEVVNEGALGMLAFSVGRLAESFGNDAIAESRAMRRRLRSLGALTGSTEILVGRPTERAVVDNDIVRLAADEREPVGFGLSRI